MLRRGQLGLAVLGASAAGVAMVVLKERMENWSGTHKCSPAAVHCPTSVEQVETMVRIAHEKQKRLKVIGSGISPNGMGFTDGEMISLREMKSIEVLSQNTVRIQCGATVAQVLEELKPHNLTLENLASINLQQIGGLYQAGAHGTGASLPPCEEQVVGMTIVTPGMGTLQLSRENDPHGLFDWCRLGLGCLGVVTDVTVRVVPLHRLKEETRVLSRAQVQANHANIISSNKHARYMWIPYEDAVVVVTSNVATPEDEAKHSAPPQEKAGALDAMRGLFTSAYPDRPVPSSAPSFADMRDALLSSTDLALDAAYIQRVNKAERAYHEAVQGVQIKDFEHTLAFDCGGQQLVLEVALDAKRDVDFALELLREIEAKGIAAPVPIEHRWTRSSAAKMSPAHGAPGEVFGWVGVVMYLISPDPNQRQRVADAFLEYCSVVMDVAKRMNVDLRVHWAKVEPDSQPLVSSALVQKFNAVRNALDPRRVFENEWSERVLGG